MIRFEDVKKTWDNGKTFAVDGISFELLEGKVLALLGGSGCGKSTTIKMINRLIEPSSGQVFLNGENIMQQDPVVLRRRIGYVFQAIGLFPHMSVYQNVAIVPKLLAKSEAEYKPRVQELLDLVQLPYTEYAQRFPSQLSGGQKQRVGFARALISGANVMLLDEPFGALDPVTRDGLQTEFLSIQRNLGLTAVIVTHDMAEALLLADQIAVLNHGKIIRFGTPRELLSNPGHEYVSQLLETPKRHSQLITDLQS